MFYDLSTKLVDARMIEAQLPLIQKEMLDEFGAADRSTWSKTSTWNTESDQVKFWLMNNGRVVYVPHSHIFVGYTKDELNAESEEFGTLRIEMVENELDGQLLDSGAVRVSAIPKSRELNIEYGKKLTPEQIDWLVDFGEHLHVDHLVFDGPLGKGSVPIESIDHLRFALEGDPRDLLVKANEATTTMSNISFLPCHVGMVKAWLKKLKKQKPDWKLEILEGENDNQLKIEDQVQFSVPKEHWSCFLNIFKGGLGENSLNLQSMVLDESKIDEKPRPIITLGYPPKEYKFTGEWSRQETGISGGRTARRNRAIIDVPIYKSDAGDIVVDMNQSRIIKKYRGKRCTESIGGLVTKDGFPLEIGMNVEWTDEDRDVWSGIIKSVDPSTKEVRIRMRNGYDVVKKMDELYVELPIDESIQEAINKDMADLRKELKTVLVDLFHDKEFAQTGESADMWRTTFGAGSHRTQRVAITCENEKRDVQKLYGKLIRAYGKDKGNLEMMIEAIRDHRPLNAFDEFRNYDYLYGTRIQSLYENVTLILESTVDFIYDATQSIYISDEDVLSEVEDEYRSIISRSRNVIYPRGGRFRPGFFDSLRRLIDDLMKGEAEHEEGR